jgi:hypothetical protein
MASCPVACVCIQSLNKMTGQGDPAPGRVPKCRESVHVNDFGCTVDRKYNVEAKDLQIRRSPNYVGDRLKNVTRGDLPPFCLNAVSWLVANTIDLDGVRHFRNLLFKEPS